MANGVKYSILVSAKTKRDCLQTLRRQWKNKNPKSLYIILFSTLVYFLLKNKVGDLSRVTIDTELSGHEGTIKEHVINLLRRKKIEVDPSIFNFWQVGKKSPAHKLAWQVFNGLIEPDRKITTEEILAEFRQQK